jgi:hypothetical protein|tara:strand:- start:50 stop:1957 length:1908 start_codon:yes stop_codon:yes gene_type:complete
MIRLIFVLLFFNFYVSGNSSSDSVKVNCELIGFNELQEIEDVFNVSDSIILFSDNKGTLFKWNKIDGGVIKIWESEGFVDKIFGTKDYIVISTQEIIYVIDYQGEIKSTINLKGRLLNCSFIKTEAIIFTSEFVLRIDFLSGKEKLFPLSNKISFGAAVRNGILLGFGSGKVEFWDFDLKKIFDADSNLHSTSISNITINRNLIYVISKNRVTVKSLNSDVVKEYLLRKNGYDYIINEEYLYWHEFGGSVFKYHFKSQSIEEVKCFEDKKDKKTKKIFSGEIKKINYKGSIIDSLKLDKQIVDFDISIDSDIWLIGTNKGKVVLTKGLNQELNEFSFDYYKGLSTVALNYNEGIFLLGSKRGVGGVYYLEDKKTIIEFVKGFANLNGSLLFKNNGVHTPLWLSKSSLNNSSIYKIPFVLGKKKRKKEREISLIAPGRDKFSFSEQTINVFSFCESENLLIYSVDNQVFTFDTELNESTFLTQSVSEITALHFNNNSKTLFIGTELGRIERLSLDENITQFNNKPAYGLPITSISSSLYGDSVFYANKNGVYQTDFRFSTRVLQIDNVSKIINNPNTREIGVLLLNQNDSTINQPKVLEATNDVESLTYNHRIKKMIFVDGHLMILTYSGLFYEVE